MAGADQTEAFIAKWRVTGGSELANTQSFIVDLCALVGVAAPNGSHADDARNDYVFERRVFQDLGDGSERFGRIDAYKRSSFILEAKQGTEQDRVAAREGKDNYDLFGQTAAARVKRGTAVRGTPGWAKAMVEAKGQAERYAKALPLDHGWPPFLLIADVGHCIEVFADFTGTGKAYAQFPDRAGFRIMLDDLRDADVRARLAAIWTAPKSLDPAAKAAEATRAIALLLAALSKRLEGRGYSPDSAATFLMRCLFTMFAEDARLLPADSFRELLQRLHARPDNFVASVTDLWTKMNSGGFVGALGPAGETVLKFNGYLFRDAAALPLDASEIALLIEAAKANWRQVEPAIFGTLLERALDPAERAKLGAHYTPRAYVERLVMPTIIEPLRADWAGVRGAAAQYIEKGEAGAALKAVKDFHAQLAGTKVLDPACGTGNFLYVAMARMKELEAEVVELLTELGDDQYVAELSGHTITPENFLGIEINPRAAAIAQLVLWIGYLQWHIRMAGVDASGRPRLLPDPILKDVRTIECRDALIAYDHSEIERNGSGRPISRWDGTTMKRHAVTGKPVPDEAAQVEVYRYVKPRAAKWPKADFIVGNPPFIGGKDLRERLGSGYVAALFKTTDVPESADFVMHWWDIAAWAVRRRTARAFGFITTNSLPQTFSRRVVAKHLDAKDGIHLTFAIPNHPWVDASDGAAVRIAITVARAGKGDGQLLTVADESGAPEVVVFHDPLTGRINSDLRVGADATQAKPLQSNKVLAFRGVVLHGDGFIVSAELAATFGNNSPTPMRSGKINETCVLFSYRNGRDLAQHPRDVKVIDLFGLSEEDVRKCHPAVYQHLLTFVRPHRNENRREVRRRNWWLYGENAPALRRAVAGTSRYIVTIETAKHRTFQFLPTNVLPDNKLLCVALDDGFALGIMSSRTHVIWALAAGGRLGVGDDPVYVKTSCFDPFPFPADVPPPLAARIRAEAEALDALRKEVLARHADLTLTGLYNVVDRLRGGAALTPRERDVHDRGLVTLIRTHHDAIDALVADAYGWGADHAAGVLTDAEILTRLVVLNRERAAEEARGLVRWLRPDFQAPGSVAHTTALDLGIAAAAPAGAIIIPWPKSLPEQVSAVAGLLARMPTPLSPHDVARAFASKRAGTVTPVLASLAAIGMARRLADGRYAA